ncbi:MAG: hypothetical protein ABI378_10415, partial [Chitinophagaceae bacterium]
TEVTPSLSDFAFFLYDLVWNEETQVYQLKLNRTVYTQFAIALEQIANFEAGDEGVFKHLLQQKLDSKRNGKEDQSSNAVN